MPYLKLLLWIHITGGGISLPLGLLIFVLKKGDSRHKLLGRIFFYAMLVAAVVAIPMAIIHTNIFLLLISILTIYLLLTGINYLHKKKNASISITDRALTMFILLFAITIIILGIIQLVKGNMFGIVFIVFGAFGLLFTRQDRDIFTNKTPVKNYWLLLHLQRMTGAYVASATAFLVVNNKILPGIVAWLLPTFILVPLIIKWSRKYKVLKKG